MMEDYQRAVERLDAFTQLEGHDVVVQSSRPATVAERAAQIGDAGAIVLIRERTPIDAPLLELLPNLRLICQTGRGMPHIDVVECTHRGIVICTGSGSAYAVIASGIDAAIATIAAAAPVALLVRVFTIGSSARQSLGMLGALSSHCQSQDHR